MPPIRKLRPSAWTTLHREQLIRGADMSHQRFGVDCVRCRRRFGPQDFHRESLPLAEQCWVDLRVEILAEANAPEDVWAYRYFDLGTRAVNHE